MLKPLWRARNKIPPFFFCSKNVVVASRVENFNPAKWRRSGSRLRLFFLLPSDDKKKRNFDGRETQKGKNSLNHESPLDATWCALSKNFFHSSAANNKNGRGFMSERGYFSPLISLFLPEACWDFGAARERSRKLALKSRRRRRRRWRPLGSFLKSTTKDVLSPSAKNGT